MSFYFDAKNKTPRIYSKTPFKKQQKSPRGSFFRQQTVMKHVKV